MRKASEFKGGGYLTSTVSVLLLAVPSLKSAMESTLMLACLIGGVVLSIAGMGMRWRSHRIEQHEKDKLEARQTQQQRGKSSHDEALASR